MYLRSLSILNYRNIVEEELEFSPKLNCLVGRNGMGKTNVLDAVYLLSFCKSSLTAQDSLNIRHGESLAMVRGEYVTASCKLVSPTAATETVAYPDLRVECGLQVGRKKRFRLNGKEYKRLQEHIGLLPLVMVSPRDGALVLEGSDERRRFMDGVISQQDRGYLQHLTEYNEVLKQRNSLLKQIGDRDGVLTAEDAGLLDVLEMQLVRHGEVLYAGRKAFVEAFVPVFEAIYKEIGGVEERVRLVYRSQLHDRELGEALLRTRQRDVVLGWTSQGVHKDDLEMWLGEYGLKQVGSQGQQKSYLVALKLAEALFLSEGERKPILLLDDIFDKLDAERVGRIVQIVGSEQFGQIFITDTDRQHLVELLGEGKVFVVENGEVKG